MPLKTVTFTGVDAETRFEDLQAFTAEFPFVEFGVLLDYAFAGRGEGYWRYPGLAYIHDLAGRKKLLGENAPQMALHLCGGRAVEEFLENVSSITSNLARQFDRVQVNADFVKEHVPHIDWSIGLHKPQTVITQHGDYLSRGHWSGMRSTNHAVLFDTSQGMGRLPASWPEPLMGKSCGYAGGLGPDNIERQLDAIHDAATAMGAANPEFDYWVDMETGVRDGNDRFSLLLCRDIARKVEKSGYLALCR